MGLADDAADEFPIHLFLRAVYFPVLVVEPLAVVVSVGILAVVTEMAGICRHGIGILAEATLEEQTSNARLHGSVRPQQDALEQPTLLRCCLQTMDARLIDGPDDVGELARSPELETVHGSPFKTWANRAHAPLLNSCRCPALSSVCPLKRPAAGKQGIPFTVWREPAPDLPASEATETVKPGSSTIRVSDT